MSIEQKTFEWTSASWEEGCAMARRFVDGLGRPVDEGILETVVALNLFDFPTHASCEGHFNWGNPYPWVDFVTPGECPGYEEALAEFNREGQSEEEQEASWHRLLAVMAAFHHKDHLYTRLEALLDTYYEAHKDISEQWRIMVDCYEPGWYRMTPTCAFEADEWPENLRSENLARAQAEMRNFTHYLKECWQKSRATLVS